MLILGLLGMYFDGVVVFVTNSSLFSDWLWPYCDDIPDYQGSVLYILVDKQPVILLVKTQNAARFMEQSLP